MEHFIFRETGELKLLQMENRSHDARHRYDGHADQSRVNDVHLARRIYAALLHLTRLTLLNRSFK